MPDTVRDMVGYLRMQCPQLPYFLAVQLLRNRHRSLARDRNWSAMRTETQLSIHAMKAGGVITATLGSATVTGVGTAFDPSDVGRQFMAGNMPPVYTVAAVVSPTELTLDQVFGNATTIDAAYRIFDGYVSMPVNFKQFLVVRDPANAWQLRFWVTQEDLARYDPQRTCAGTPWVLADRGINAAGQPVFELWPFQLSEHVYTAAWFGHPTDLQNPDDIPMRGVTGEILVKGAMIDVCRWPGTRDDPNPLFGAKLDMVYAAEYKDLADQAEVQDENLMMTWLQPADSAAWPYAPYDAKWLQTHA